MTANEVLDKGKWYVDTYRKTLENMPSLDRGPLYNTSYAGLGFACEEMPEYREFRTYFDKISVDDFELSLPAEASRLNQLMLEDTEAFEKEINHHSGGVSKYATIPVLSHIPPAEFADNFLKLAASIQKEILVNLQIRYKFNNLSRDLKREFDWLLAFREEILRRTDGMQPITSFRLRRIIRWTVDDIDEVKEKLNADSS